MKKDNKLFTEGELEIFLRVLSAVPTNSEIQFGNVNVLRTSDEIFQIRITDDVIDYTLPLSNEQTRQEELKKFLEGL